MDKRTLVGLLIAHDLLISWSAYIFLKNLEVEKQRYKKLYDLTHYVLRVAEEQGVDISEFDLIALKTISEGTDATER